MFNENYMELPAFDESIEAPLKNIYHIIGETTRKNSLEEYQRVFPNQKEENIIMVPGTGHWLQNEEPEAVQNLIIKFLKKMDGDKE